MINKMDYVQAAALVKVQEKKMLNKAKINRMIDSNTALEILKILNETDYSKSMVGITTEEEYELILSNELDRVYKFANELVKENKEVLEIIQLKNEFQKMKTQLKCNIKDNSNEEIDEKYLTYYKQALAEYEKTDDVQAAVITLDRLYFQRLGEMCKELNLEILNRYYELSLRSYNLLTFIRLKNQKRTYKYAQYCLFDDEELLRIYETDTNYISSLEKYYDDKNVWQQYMKDSKISSLEKALENSFVSLIKEYKNVNYGIEPIITYVIAKEYEVKAIRLIMTAKINKIPAEVIKERLRDIYV